MAPDIVEAAVAGSEPVSLSTGRLRQGVPMSREEQREMLTQERPKR